MYFVGKNEFLGSSLTRRIGIALLENVLNNPHTIMTYGMLSKEIGGLVRPKFLGEFLGDLSVFCKCNGLPLISAVVYNEKDGRPGDGFYRAFYSGDIPENKKFEIFNRSIEDVRSHMAEWKELLILLKNFKIA